VVWLLSHLAAALTAQKVLQRREAELYGEGDEPSAAAVLAAQMSEPLAGLCDEPYGSLSVEVLTLFILRYDAILEGQVTYGDGDAAPPPQPEPQFAHVEHAAAMPGDSRSSSSAAPIAAQPAGMPPQQAPSSGAGGVSPLVSPSQYAQASLPEAAMAMQHEQSPLPQPQPSAHMPMQQGAGAPASQRVSLHGVFEDPAPAAAVARALDMGGDVNEVNADGFTVLMVACSLGMPDVVRLVLPRPSTRTSLPSLLFPPLPSFCASLASLSTSPLAQSPARSTACMLHTCWMQRRNRGQGPSLLRSAHTQPA